MGVKWIQKPVYVGENARLEFVACDGFDYLTGEALDDVTTIQVVIRDPNGSDYTYTGTKATIDGETAGGFYVTLLGSNHSVAGTAYGRVKFDAVTEPDSEFKFTFKSTPGS
jgi:hypothetical protein